MSPTSLQMTAISDLLGRTVQSVTEFDYELVIICENNQYLLLKIEDDACGDAHFSVRQEAPVLYYLSEQHPLVLHGIFSLAEVRAARQLQREQEQERLKTRERQTYERLKAIYEKS